MILIRYKEIGIKGRNRTEIEKQLQRNIKTCLKLNKISYESVIRLHGRQIIITDKECPQLKFVPGISSFSYAEQCPLDFDAIKEKALSRYTEGTFRITCQRMDDFYMSSKEMEKEVGAYIVEKTNAKVKLKDADQDIHIEIISGKAYLFADKILGMGGVPLNADSRVVLLLQNNDSVKAGIKMLKRGCMMDVFKEKDIDYSELKKYEYGFTIHELDKITDDKIVVVSDTLDSMHEYPYFVLRPLI